jgi:hypothetical protein
VTNEEKQPKQSPPKPAQSQSPFKKPAIEKIERGRDPAGIERFTKQ